MSTTAKTITWMVVAVVIVGGAIWWYVSMSPTATAPGYSNTTPTTMNATSTDTTTPPPANDVSVTGTSNAALQADLSQTDNQMSGFSSDNTSINNGLNDQEIQQSQF